MSKGGGGDADYQKAVDNQNAYNNEMHSYNWAQTQANYATAMENLAIQKINETATKNYQDQTNFNGWLDRENIRLYEYGKEVEAYNASVESYEDQLDYNNLAYDIALNDANRVYQDQLTAFGFQNQDLLMKYHEGGEQASLDTQGLTNKLTQAQALSDLQVRETAANKDWDQAQKALEDAGLRQGLAAVKAETAFKAQGERISYLGKEGQQRNLGQAGRSAAKAVQGLLATHGMSQAALADSISKADSKYMLDKRRISEELRHGAKMTNIKYSQIANTLLNTKQDAQHQQDQIGLKFSQLKDRTDFNRQQLSESMKSADGQYKADKQKLVMDKYQQDLTAAANLMSVPSAPPQETQPLGIPETTWQDPTKPTKPPIPAEAVNTYQGPSMLQQVGQVVGIAASLYSMSDLEVKDNIVRKGRSPRGFPIYEFNYKHEPNHRYQGVMGQDLLELLPSAVVEADNGYLAVDYSQLDVEFKQI
tara:strand:+ start:3808 stop:5241 length:1434 start_codon:yes stop_codon:yes gene_type:complete